MSNRVHLLIDGEVQGVGFRAFIKRKALQKQVTGSIRNLENGKVEVIIQGNKEEINSMIEICKKGPPWARVSNVDIDWNDKIEDYKEFRII